MIRFAKYHGLGNDFLIVDAGSLSRPLTDDDVRHLCDRKAGIGADGVLFFEEGPAPAHAQMRVYNADGSQPEMCGNGIRCLVKHCIDVLGLKANPLIVHTDAGLKSCTWVGDDNGVQSVVVEMGPPSFDPVSIPLSNQYESHRIDLNISEELLSLHCASMGNPHAVLFGARTRDEIGSLAPLIQAHPAFPRGVNVGFANPAGSNGFELTVYERGAGLTEACGTGACAAIALAVKAGLFAFDEEVLVYLPGGRLGIRVAPDYRQIWMTGPAVHMKDGQVPFP